MNPLPLLLLGGAAVLMMMGGKKTTKDDDAADAESEASAAAEAKPLLAQRSQVQTKQFIAQKANLPSKGSSGGSSPTTPKEDPVLLAWVETNAAILCAQPPPAIAAQAKIYAAIATKGMQKASGRKLKKRRAEFPCEYKNRLSWTVDEAFKLWVQGNPKATTTANFYNKAGAWLGAKAKKHRPWNTMIPEQANRTLTAISSGGSGMRHVIELDLSPCARHIRNLLTEEIRKKCGKERGGLKKILPWNWDE